MNVLAVDPGGTTGLATWVDGAHNAWHRPLDDAMSAVHCLLATPYLVDLCVFESYTVTAETVKKSRTGGNGAMEFIGVGRYLSRCYGVRFALQTPSDAKRFATDDKLRAMGWWTKGLDHPRDASRHLLLALVRERQIDPAELLEKQP